MSATTQGNEYLTKWMMNVEFETHDERDTPLQSTNRVGYSVGAAKGVVV